MPTFKPGDLVRFRRKIVTPYRPNKPADLPSPADPGRLGLVRHVTADYRGDDPAAGAIVWVRLHGDNSNTACNPDELSHEGPPPVEEPPPVGGASITVPIRVRQRRRFP